MIRMTAFAAMLMLVAAAPSIAGENPSAKLAMHVVASDQYLYCPDLTPPACDSINVDVSAAEILATGGYGYVAFVAYEVEGLTGAEFAVSGWPSGRGAPQLSGPYWCPDGTLTLGDHMASGGIASFPCAETSAAGLVLVGYCSFGPLDEEDLPITLEYAESEFSYPNDPHNYVLDCTVQFREDAVVGATGCTIGGVQPEGPDCGSGYGGAGEGSEDSGETRLEATIDQSYLYIKGNYISGPYHLVLDGDTVRVNGIPVEPLRQRLAPPHPRLRRSEADLLNEAVATEGYRLFTRLRDQIADVEILRDSVEAFFFASGRVDSIQVSRSSVQPYWREGWAPAYVIMPWIPQEQIPESDRDPVLRRQGAFGRWKRDLESDRVILVSKGMCAFRGVGNAGPVHELIQQFQAGNIPLETIAEIIRSDWAVNELAAPKDLEE